MENNTSTTPTMDQTGPSSCPGPRHRRCSTSSTIGRLRRASRTFEESNLPEGFLAATGDFASTILPTPQASSAISSKRRRDSKSNTIPEQEPLPPTQTDSKPPISPITSKPQPSPSHAPRVDPVSEIEALRDVGSESATTGQDGALLDSATFANGYHFPPKRPFVESFKLGLKAFLQYWRTPVGFFVVLYGLNVVAWGGMLFLLLCNAAPAMCHPTCGDMESPRLKWIEIDSQIVNALFCVTGFGLAPWRFRDLYFLLLYRVGRKTMGLRRLAGIHRSWVRLPESEKLPVEMGPVEAVEKSGSYPEESVPYPLPSTPEAPLTGIRAPPTKTWKLDWVILMNVGNTLLQCVLAFFMWHYNRYNRPAWAVGMFVGLACVAAGLGGLMIFLEGRKVKGVEGVPLSEGDLERLEKDRELGIPHYNNLKDKKPKDQGEKEEGTAESKEQP